MANKRIRDYDDGSANVQATDVIGIDRAALDELEKVTLQQAVDATTALTSSDIGVTVQAYDADLSALAALTDPATKLAGIEAGAEVNDSASEILTKLLTVDGAGSGLDADLLDGNSSAHYATASSVSDHLADTTDAHDASAISFSPVGTIAATDAQTAIAEVATDAASALSSHESDTTSVHGITDTSTLYRSGGTDVAVADGGTGASNAADARTNLGLVIGTNVQAQDAELAAIAGLTSAADRLPYFTGSGTASLATFTSVARDLLDDTTVGAQRSTLAPLNTVATTGATETLVIGVNDCTMDQNCTFTFPTVGAGRHEFTLILRGAFTPTFPASVDWGGGAAPTYASPSEYSFATVDSGTTWFGVGSVGFA